MSRRVADLLIRIGADTAEFRRKMEDASSNLKRFENQAKDFAAKADKIGKQWSMRATVPLVALGGLALSLTGQFDTAMREVSTLSQEITNNIKDYSNQIVEVTKKIPVGATESAKALYQIVSAGHDGANGMKVLEVAARAAVAGVTDTTTAADAITTLLNAYGLSADSAESVSDQLFTTVRLGKTTFGELGSKISTVAATAASFGIKTEEVLAAVATLTKMGVPTAQAMTQIRASIMSTAKVLGDGAFKGCTLQTALQDVADNAKGSFTQMMKDAGQVEAVNAILGMTGKNAKVAAADLEILGNSSGAAAEAHGKMADGFENRLKLLKNNVSALMLNIGTILLPVAEKIVKVFNLIINSLSGVSEPIKKLIVGLGLAVAAFGPLTLVVSKTISILPSLASGFIAMLSPIGLVAAAILALGSAYLYTYNRKQELLSGMTDKFSNLSTGTLEKMLEENKRKQDVNEIESPWQGNSIYSKVAYALNKGDRREDLKMEEEALTEAIRRNKQAAEERNKSEAEAAKIAEQIKSATQGINAEIKEGTGLTGALTSEIKKLEEQKPFAKTLEDLGKINTKIEEYRKQLDGLNKYKGRVDATPVVSGDVKGYNVIDKLAAKYKISINKIVSLVTEAQNRMAVINDVVANGIYGWADKSNRAMQGSISRMSELINQYSDKLIEVGWRMEDATSEVASAIQNQLYNLRASVEDVIDGIAGAIGESIAGMIVGDMGFNDLLKGIASQIGGFIKSLGQILVQYAAQMIVLQMSLKSIIANPWLALAAGTAMIIVGSVIQSLISKKQKDAPKLAKGGLAFGPTYAMIGDNPNPRVDPEVVAPLSKLKQFMNAGSSSVDIALTGSFGIKGRDLVYVIGKENYKLKLIKG